MERYVTHTWGATDKENIKVLKDVSVDIDNLLAFCCDKSAVLVSKLDVEQCEDILNDYIDKAQHMGGIKSLLDDINSKSSFNFREHLQRVSAQAKEKDILRAGRKGIQSEDLKEFLSDMGVTNK